MSNQRIIVSLLFLGALASAQGIITTMAAGSTSPCGFGGDGGPVSLAQLCGPEGAAVDGSGNIYFYDSGNYRIRQVSPAGIINTVAGNGTRGTSGDGGPALSAQLGALSQLAVDPTGQHLCFGDNDAHKIRCLTLTTGMIQGYGTGVQGLAAGDGGNVANATFYLLDGAAFDDQGNFYISDSSSEDVRRVDAVTGIITTFAGPGPGYCCAATGDGGPAAGANLYQPEGLAFRSGTLYIADEGNDRVRSVSLATGIINTVAGNGTAFDSGDGSPATSVGVRERWLAVDPSGNLFISIGSTVRMVDSSGIINTIAGTPGIGGIGADYIPATQTVFESILGLAWDPGATRLLITDSDGRIRQIFYTPATTTALSPSENPAHWNDTVTLQATVQPADATGSVRFYYNAPYPASQGLWNFLGSAPIANGMATISWTAPVGDATYSLSAVYAGDPAHNLSQSPIVSEVVQQGRSATSLASSLNPSVQGQSVTLTATVTPTGVTGSVTFQSNGGTLGSAVVNNGVAALTTAALPTGSDAITATYSGDSRYAGSTASLTQIVKATTTTALSTSPNPSLPGAAVTLTAAVSPSGATGTVQFYNGATLLGSASLSGGQAQLVVTNLPAGSNSLTAVYSGDSTDAGSTSVAVTQVVRVATTTTFSSSPNPSTFGAAVTLTAVVSPASATGSVTFYNGSTALGSANLASGQAQLTTSSLPAGSDAITAAYGGDANDAPSTSAVKTQTVNKANSTTTLAASPASQSTSGQTVTLTATVRPPAATGTVQFLDGSTVIGSAPVNNGTAVFATSSLSTGNHSIKASYGGDANVNPSQSGALSYKVKR